MKFDVRYYLIAILFILFDLEIAFLFRAVVLPEIGIFGFWSMMIFWHPDHRLRLRVEEGALEWSSQVRHPARARVRRGDRRQAESWQGRRHAAKHS